jgi:hypothetical protein
MQRLQRPQSPLPLDTFTLLSISLYTSKWHNAGCDAKFRGRVNHQTAETVFLRFRIDMKTAVTMSRVHQLERHISHMSVGIASHFSRRNGTESYFIGLSPMK